MLCFEIELDRIELNRINGKSKIRALISIWKRFDVHIFGVTLALFHFPFQCSLLLCRFIYAECKIIKNTLYYCVYRKTYTFDDWQLTTMHWFAGSSFTKRLCVFIHLNKFLQFCLLLLLLLLFLLLWPIITAICSVCIQIIRNQGKIL